MEILTTGRQIRDKVRWVLGDQNDTRVVLVAFVGKDALEYIDNPRGVKVYCWLKIPSTNPVGLLDLYNEGAKLFSVNNLHAKVFWSKRRGAVIGSPNLSRNAFGDGGLIEIAVYLPPGVIDAALLTRRLQKSEIHKFEITQYERDYNLYQLRNPQKIQKAGSSATTFLQWRKKGIRNWKLYWYSEFIDPPKDVQKALGKDTGSEYYREYISSGARTHYRVGEWVLCLKYSYSKDGKFRGSRLEWFLPEKYYLTRKSGAWAKDNNIWFQIGRLPNGAPFSLNDPVFKQAFIETIAKLGNQVERVVTRTTEPSEQFLDELEKRYKALQKKP